NPSGDFLAAPRCGAQTRSACPCRQPAMANGRCRLHGGKSTGARTAAGLARVRANRLVHGAPSAQIIAPRSAPPPHPPPPPPPPARQRAPGPPAPSPPPPAHAPPAPRPPPPPGAPPPPIRPPERPSFVRRSGSGLREGGPARRSLGEGGCPATLRRRSAG